MRNPEKHELMVGVKKYRKSYAVINGSNIGCEQNIGGRQGIRNRKLNPNPKNDRY